MNTPMSELEQVVMSIVWDCDPCSIKDIKTKLDTKKKLAYTTVATLVQRLERKRMLKRVECDCPGRCIRYSPKITKREYSSVVAGNFFSEFQTAFPETAITSFADSIKGMRKDKRNYLLALLSENEK